MNRRRRCIQLLVVGLPILMWHSATLAGGEGSQWYGRIYGAEEWQPESTVPTKPQEAPGMIIWEMSKYARGEQTPEQKAIATDLIERSYKAAKEKGWAKFKQSILDDYYRMYADPLHYANETYILDDVVLDPERPEFLMYATMPNQDRELVGFMFLNNDSRAHGEQIGGAETLWHYHMWSIQFCLLEELLVVGEPNEEGVCQRGKPSHRSAEMIHVWLVDHPEGPYSTNMTIDPELIPGLLQKRMETHGF